MVQNLSERVCVGSKAFQHSYTANTNVLKMLIPKGGGDGG